MALTDENGGNFNVSMPVQPMGGGYGGYSYPMAYPVMPYSGGFGGGFGDGFGGDWIILFLFAMMFGGGWGGMGSFGGWGGGFGNMFEFPWLLNGQNGINNNVNDGFRTSQLQDSVTSVRDGVSNLATQLCDCCGNMQMSMANGFAGVNQNVSQGFANTNLGMCQGFNGVTNAVTGAQNAISQQLYSNELASLNRSFAEQTANTQGFNSVQSQLAQNGYNQAAGTADLKYTIATEACADRANSTQNTQSILNLVNSGIQSIKDQLCQDKIDAKNDEIAQLRQEILYTRGQAAAESIYQRGQNSQDVQTAQILAGQAAIPGQVYTRLNECPVSTVPVYGRQPIFTCNNGCGCSGATAF
jgi:hypothetical protein